MTITSNLLDIIERLGVVEGEVDNIMEAALRDIGDNAVQAVSAAWPVFGGPRPPSKRADSTRVPSRLGRPHSANLWRAEQRAKLSWFIVNDADYSSYVHMDKGEPLGLAVRLLLEITDEVQGDPLDFVSDRIFAAIEHGDSL